MNMKQINLIETKHTTKKWFCIGPPKYYRKETKAFFLGIGVVY